MNNNINNPNNKTEKELLDEAMAKWPEELEREIEEIHRKYDSIEKSRIVDLKSEEDILSYCSDCIPWEDFVKEWIK